MSDIAEVQSLYDRICGLPDMVVGEILDGELVVSPRPVPRHAQVLITLAGWFATSGLLDRSSRSGWVVWPEVELHLGDHVIVPDLSGWRLTRLPAPDWSRHPSLAPDWVCEILSPSTARIDRGIKLDLYHRFQVSHCWLIDPIQRHLDCLARGAAAAVRPSRASARDSVGLVAARLNRRTGRLPRASGSVTLDRLERPRPETCR